MKMSTQWSGTTGEKEQNNGQKSLRAKKEAANIIVTQSNKVYSSSVSWTVYVVLVTSFHKDRVEL